MRRYRLIDIDLYVGDLYIKDIIKGSIVIEENQSISNGVDLGSGVAGSLNFNIYDSDKKINIKNLIDKNITLRYTLLNGLNGEEETRISYMSIKKIRREGNIIRVEAVDQHTILQKPLIEIIGGEVIIKTSLFGLLEEITLSTGIKFNIINKAFMEEIGGVLREIIEVNKEQITGYNVIGAVASINGGIFRSVIDKREIEIINMKDLIDTSKRSRYYYKDELFIDTLIGETIEIGGVNYNGGKDIGSGDILTIPNNFFIDKIENKEDIIKLIYNQVKGLRYRSIKGNMYYEPDVRAGMFIGSQEYEEPVYISKMDGTIGGKLKLLSEAMSLKDNELLIPEHEEEVEIIEPEPTEGVEFTLLGMGHDYFRLRMYEDEPIMLDPVVYYRLDNVSEFFIETHNPVFLDEIIDEDGVLYKSDSKVESNIDDDIGSEKGIGITPEAVKKNIDTVLELMKEIGDKENRRVYVDEVILDITEYYPKWEDMEEYRYKELFFYEDGYYWMGRKNDNYRFLEVPYYFQYMMIMKYNDSIYTQTFGITPVDKNNILLGGFDYKESEYSSPTKDDDYINDYALSVIYISDDDQYYALDIRESNRNYWDLEPTIKNHPANKEVEELEVDNSLKWEHSYTERMDDTIFISNFNWMRTKYEEIINEIKDISTQRNHEEVLLWQRTKSPSKYKDLIIVPSNVARWKTIDREILSDDNIIESMINEIETNEEFRKRSLFRFYRHREYFDRGFLYEMMSGSIQSYVGFEYTTDDGLYRLFDCEIAHPPQVPDRYDPDYRFRPLSERQEISEGFVSYIVDNHQKILYKGEPVVCEVRWRPGFWDKDDPNLVFDWKDSNTRAVPITPLIQAPSRSTRHFNDRSYDNIKYREKPLINQIGGWQKWVLEGKLSNYVRILLSSSKDEEFTRDDFKLLYNDIDLIEDVSIEYSDEYDNIKNMYINIELKKGIKYDIIESVLLIKSLSWIGIENIKTRR